MASLGTARMKGRDANRITDLKQMQLAIELFFESCREYPDSLTSAINNGCTGATTLGDFINPIPLDPNGGAYTYAVDANNADYVIGTQLEGGDNTVLQNDIDGTVLSQACNDPVYCLTP